MSYCRFGENSDVYVYTDGDELHCCSCRLTALASHNEQPDFSTDSRNAMIQHLDRHVREGHNVDPEAFERLRDELTESGDAVGPSLKLL